MIHNPSSCATPKMEKNQIGPTLKLDGAMDFPRQNALMALVSGLTGHPVTGKQKHHRTLLTF